MLDFRGQVERALQSLEQDRPAEAEQGFRAALGMNPRDDQLLHLLGVALVQQQRAEEALEPLRKAISLQRRDANYHNTLGCALRDTGRYAEALQSFERALKLDPGLDSVQYNLGQCYQRMGEFARAEEKFVALLVRRPEDFELVGAMSRLRWQAADFEAAVKFAQEGVARHSSRFELRFLLADELLALGRFEEGWSHYLSRTNRIDRLRTTGMLAEPGTMPSLLEASLADRTIHVYGEQGIGDELFFLRFVRFLRERGARVNGIVTPRIAAMVERSGVFDEVTGATGPAPSGASHVFLGDLPYVLAAHRWPVPATVKIAPLEAKLAQIDARLAGLPRPLIGLTWRAGTGPEAGNRQLLYKEVPFDELARLSCDLPGSLLILQREPRQVEVEKLMRACGPRVVDFSALNADLESMLAILARIDEYIGVSNTNMHLSAALGRSARVLVSHGVEFRWMAQGAESPWFPGMRVYRQAASGDWTGALESLKSSING